MEGTVRRFTGALAAAAAAALLLSHAGFAANRREAPITALDHKADITDWFAFVSLRSAVAAILTARRRDALS
jgi:hypothetical protein